MVFETYKQWISAKTIKLAKASHHQRGEMLYFTSVGCPIHKTLSLCSFTTACAVAQTALLSWQIPVAALTDKLCQQSAANEVQMLEGHATKKVRKKIR